MNDVIERLKGIKMKDMEQFLDENRNEILKEDHAFADYMRAKFKEKCLSQQDVFVNYSAIELPSI